MPFPIAPRLQFGDSEADFLIQDPFGLRRSITPVFVAPHGAEPIIGLGTSFFIHPLGTQLTAMHVLTDVINGRVCDARRLDDRLEFRNFSLGILHDPGLVYGMRPAGTFLRTAGMFVFPDDNERNPMVFSLTQRELMHIEPALDIANLSFTHPTPGGLFQPLPVDHGSRNRLRIGDRVMAIGYPRIVGTPRPEMPTGAWTRYSEEMRGSIATVIELHETRGPGHSRWPTFIVDQTWANGMSGGPIFDEHGSVVGVVSRGGPGFSSGVWLQLLPSNLPGFAALDESNPGWIRGWCVFDATTRRLLAVCQSREEAERVAMRFPNSAMALGSHRYGSDEYIVTVS